MNRDTAPRALLASGPLAWLADGPVLLDGGLATQLSAQGNDLSDELWSARLLADAPEEIRKAHRVYFQAGAEVVITASYQASFAGFARRGVSSADAEQLVRRSVRLAQQARDDVEPHADTARVTDTAPSGRAPRRWVAASIGPYGATLADGSEYRGRYGLTYRQLLDFHRPRLHVLAEAAPDLFAVETIPDCDEAAVIIELLGELQIPGWLSFTVADGRTAAGQPLREAFAMAEGSAQVFAVGLNCSSPEEVLPALSTMREVSSKASVAYPNSGERWNPASRSWVGAAGWSPPLSAGWIEAGVDLIGGCCRTTPRDIARLARQLGRRTSGQDADAAASSSPASQPR